MSVSPPPERIDVCTPPDSPTAAFDVHCSPDIHENELPMELESPRKRSRPLTARTLKRKRQESRLEMSEEDFPSTSTLEATTRDNEDSGCMDTYDEDLGTVAVNPEMNGASSNDTYEQYLELALANCAEFFQISSTLFVVQGWDGTRLSRHWYHLQAVHIGDATATACLCPQDRRSGSTNICVHRQFLNDFEVERFPDHMNQVFESEDAAVLFARSGTEDDSFVNEFSVPTPGNPQMYSRAFVSHRGADTGSGLWSCTKDPTTTRCVHISRARDKLQQLLQRNPQAKDTRSGEGDVGGDTIAGGLPGIDCNDIIVGVRKGGRTETRSVSYLPILPPRWATLPTDPNIYERQSPQSSIPTVVVLDSESSCPCPGTRSMYNRLLPVMLRPCTIYTLTGAVRSSVELQVCPQCEPARRRSIGPDARQCGLFNYNNRILFTHDLLEEYISAYTISETPFTAFVTEVSRRYKNYESPDPFIGEEMFRAVWFAFVELIRLEDDMKCPTCGPSPEDVIWDGVTLAFSRKHLLSSLEPPTTLSLNSPIRSDACYNPQQQLIIDAKLRSMVRKAVTGKPLPSLSDSTSDDTLLSGAEPRGLPVQTGERLTRKEATRRRVEEAKRKAEEVKRKADAAAALLHIKLIQEVSTSLQSLHTSVAEIFDSVFGLDAFTSRQVVPKVYRDLFVQISADESVLQAVNRPALHDLKQFLDDPSAITLSHLVSIPMLYHILKENIKTDGRFSGTILALCGWVYQRGNEIFLQLRVHSTEGDIFVPPPDPPGWKTTGCCYSMPQIRHRPKYPQLTHDQRKEVVGSRGAKCSKYYAHYGERRLTGGIMCAWCTHSICYGFHCIPQGEGRNDVFSAMITRWPKAPKRVVYDFACALGPYCMIREAEFFADTLFVIDAFHSKGHTKCAPAAFVTSYSAIDPRLGHINSSAAECGNSGLSRIRKSVSYMSQERAIIYSKVFLSIWNRSQITKIIAIQR